MERRTFLQLGALTTAAVPFRGWPRNLDHRTTGRNAEDIRRGFSMPPLSGRPFVRWWWNGDRVTSREVLRQLDVLKANGIGGVEINPIKWNGNADPAGIPELAWGSKAWLDVVYTAVTGARDRGMACDMIVGSGWPYGGEFVPRSEQGQIIALGTLDLDGGESIQLSRKELLDSIQPHFAFPYANSEKALFMLRLAPAGMRTFTPGRDLGDGLHQDEITFTVPPGKHVLYYLVKITGFAAVIQGAAGANGPVINHYDQTAVQHYLDHFGETLSSRLGRLNPFFRAFFTDSIELEGANWCSDMFDQFQRRRGYGLEPYFPYILFKTGEMGNRVAGKYGSDFAPPVKEMLDRIRYDFEITKQEIFRERFIQTFVNWCHAQGVKSRMQAYGMDCNALEASMLPDIPECETWIWGPDTPEFTQGDPARNYTNVNKFVSSAAHLNNQRHISCEEMTNTSRIFDISLEKIKVTGDQSNLSGVTHSILHGFNYSPAEIPFPGWIRYGTYFSEKNTWWPYFKLWSAYKTRISYLLGQSEMQADLAVMHPLADLASRFGFQRDPFPRVSYPPYVHRVWEPIHQSGYGCDYITEHILQQAHQSEGLLIYNRRKYRAIVLIEVESMELATAKALKAFADGGGKVIFIAKTPHQSTGLAGAEEQGREIAAISREILSAHPHTAGIVDAPGDDMLRWFEQVSERFTLRPYVTIDRPVYHASQLYYKTEDLDIFYWVNYSTQFPHHFRAKFDSSKTPWIWNAETGERKLYPVNAGGELEITLNPCETQFIVFDKAHQGETYRPPRIADWKKKAIRANWKLDLRHVNGTTREMTLTTLGDLQQNPGMDDFAGTITYRTQLAVDSLPEQTYLDLGRTGDITELWINDKPAGTRWYGIHRYDITSLLRPGNNDIKIKLTTVLGRYTHALKDNKAAREWSQDKVNSPIGLTQDILLLQG